MELQRVSPTVVRGTFHTYELAALIAAARYVAETAPEDVPSESLDQLRQLLSGYDQQVQKLAAAH
ncbi:hypothetical protein ABIA32_003828 [Streptacidiphilus sp. MAP12-20]|uniref:hypothetical protein n=1 Tax=Streptacidiphilus sp. MAP12-20 TaxID=3156299 RepID=UPI003516CCC8